ncbi:MAG TPA: hypothetical protein VFG14_05030 [Chthoniobacteraceae bacterium]|nr:hypothetical protein [Chthoniobacteraceae bacterium]
MDESAQPANQARPDAVVALFIIFCFGAALFFGLFGYQLVDVVHGRDKSASVLEVSGAIFALMVRSVGMIRLLLMKADSWVWLVVAVVIGLPITILGILNHRVIGSDITWPVIASAAHYIIAIGIIVYAFRLFNGTERK